MTDPDRFEEMRKRLEARLKPSRYLHSMGVSQTAARLARTYGADEDAAAVAGLLHDWDKALSPKELKRLAKKRKLAPKAVRKQMPGVLHALTAPYSLKKEFPELSDEILRAISLHTCGAKDMEDLDRIVYIADVIEPGRNFDGVGRLREAAGRVSLDELFFMAYASTLAYLVQGGLPIHPGSLDVWNSLVAKRAKGRACGSFAAQRADSSSDGDCASSGGADGASKGEVAEDEAPAGEGGPCLSGALPSEGRLARELAERIVAGHRAIRGPRNIVIE